MERANAVWPVAPPGGALADGEVAVWRVALVASTAELDAARALLTPEELRRAERFFRAEDRTSFTLQRAALRAHLGAYLGESAAGIRFAVGEKGKPAIAGAGAWLEFNSSGSGEWALLAFARGGALGVDVEKHRALEASELARQFFSREENAELAALPEAQRADGFFNAWVRKEAFVKALGLGLYYPLNQFTVSLAPDTPARLVAIEGSPEKAAEWSLQAIAIAEGYSGAIVRRGGPFALRCGASPALQNWPR